MPELDFENEIEIDPDALDIECLRQATLFMRYSKEEAKAKKSMARAWENLKVTRSRLILEVSGDKAYSNAQKVEAYYRTHPDHIAAKEEFVVAEYEANMASAAVHAFRQRKYMIENLVRLGLADYFARPVEPRDLGGEYVKSKEDKQKDAKTKRASRRSRK